MHPTSHAISLDGSNRFSRSVSDVATDGRGSRSGASSGTPRVTGDTPSAPHDEPLSEDAARSPPIGLDTDDLTSQRGRQLMFPAQHLLPSALLAWSRRLARSIGWLLTMISVRITLLWQRRSGLSLGGGQHF